MQCLRRKMQSKTFLINNKTECLRIDVFLAKETDYSRSHIKKLCDCKNVFVNGVEQKCNYILKIGDEITLNIPEQKQIDAKPKDIPIDIVYEDDDLAVINKPQGLTVHAGNGTDDNTLVNALLYKLDSLSGINGVLRPGIVHRIDKNTSGLLVVAKNDKAHIALAKQLEDKTCHRIYVALLEGIVKDDEGTIRTFIARDPKNRTKMAVSKSGRLAITHYKVVERFIKGYTLCEFSLETGRTHQIRVHAKYIGHPIVGDAEYGYKSNKFNLKGQLLHAKKLEFVHPALNQKVSFEAPIPDYFENVLNKIKN